MSLVNERHNHDVERKSITILNILRDATEPVGARVMARELTGHGIELSERAVRYHLQLLDERGFTKTVGRDGRRITPHGLEELKSALVTDKLGVVLARIEDLAFRTTLDPSRGRGTVAINISLFCKGQFEAALAAMRNAFQAGLCASTLVAVAKEGERLGDTLVPEGKMALATVCSVTVNAVLLKGGIPMNSLFGGILEMRASKPLRFTELISYSGSSLDPSEVFIRGKMTSVGAAARAGDGKVLANFREIPAACFAEAQELIKKLRKVGIVEPLVVGHQGEPVCEVPVGWNRAGVVLRGGLNPAAAAVEAGLEVENYAMSSTLEFSALRPFPGL
ncbi:MAG: DUF128 domain-containing protein [Dehalococcoidia bacterium]|nr:DUF128 domain-containing protein [Dehalococcoidia bacterium]